MAAFTFHPLILSFLNIPWEKISHNILQQRAWHPPCLWQTQLITHQLPSLSSLPTTEPSSVQSRSELGSQGGQLEFWLKSCRWRSSNQWAGKARLGESPLPCSPGCECAAWQCGKQPAVTGQRPQLGTAVWEDWEGSLTILLTSRPRLGLWLPNFFCLVEYSAICLNSSIWGFSYLQPDTFTTDTMVSAFCWR